MTSSLKDIQDCSRKPKMEPMVRTMRAGSVNGANSAIQTPSVKEGSNSAASCNDRRVLPVPPGPISVNKRADLRRFLASPIKVVSCTGRLFGKASIDLSGGKSEGRAASVA